MCPNGLGRGFVCWVQPWKESWSVEKIWVILSDFDLQLFWGDYESSPHWNLNPVYPHMRSPGTFLSSIFRLKPSKTRSLPTKTRVIWVPGLVLKVYTSGVGAAKAVAPTFGYSHTSSWRSPVLWHHGEVVVLMPLVDFLCPKVPDQSPFSWEVFARIVASNGRRYFGNWKQLRQIWWYLFWRNFFGCKTCWRVFAGDEHVHKPAKHRGAHLERRFEIYNLNRSSECFSRVAFWY